MTSGEFRWKITDFTAVKTQVARDRIDSGFSFSCVFCFFAFQLQFFATLLHLIGSFVQILFAKPVNSNVVQDKVSYDTILNKKQ